MENPLALPAPDDPIERIHAFARDLAYGFSIGLWGSEFDVVSMDLGEFWNPVGIQSGSLSTLCREKWNNAPPRASALNSFGYLKVSENDNHVLTLRAFDLLKTPVTPPTIFISYRRDVSSALSLLIEARLKLADRNIGVFIDKALEPGDEWHGRLEAHIMQSQYFICLLAPETLKSGFVRKEIMWALGEKQKRKDFAIIPFCHNGFRLETAALPDDSQKDQKILSVFEVLTGHHAIPVERESAEQYELALNKLLNKLGYSTI